MALVAGASGLVGTELVRVLAASGDYRLQARSPAVDSGVDVGLAYDRDGNARPAGKGPDVGPYERVP